MKTTKDILLTQWIRKNDNKEPSIQAMTELSDILGRKEFEELLTSIWAEDELNKIMPTLEQSIKHFQDAKLLAKEAITEHLLEEHKDS